MTSRRLLTIGILVVVAIIGCCGLLLVIGALSDRSPLRTPAPEAAEVLAETNPTATPEPDLPVEPTVTPEPTAMPEPTATPAPPTPTPVPQLFNGVGQQVAGPLTLGPGLVVATMTHDGGSNFAITVLDGQGDLVSGLVNEIGPFNGSKAIQVDGGSYVLNIMADGNWTVTIAQPGPPAELAGPPLTLTGRGQQATQFFRLEGGLATFQMSHNGSSNFAILILDPIGRPADFLVNEIGPFDGSKATGLESGPYLLDITADGDWTVTVNQ